MSSFLLPLFKFQPGKAIFTLFAVAFNTVRMPLWLLYYIPRFTRQNPNWTYHQAVRVRLVRAFLYFTSLAEPKISMSKKPAGEKERYVLHGPASKSHLVDFTLKDPKIQPVEIGGTWYPASPSPQVKSGYVVLHFHGGAYAIGDGRDADAGFAAKTLIANTDATHVFAPQYRLATHPNSRFPAQIQDAIASYTYLLYTVGIDPSKIIVSGDSAGANLALGLMRYIEDNGTATGLPAIGCAWLFSPWVSPHNAKYRPEAFHKSPLRHSDYVTAAFGQWGAEAIEPNKESGLTLNHECINFVGQPFHSETPIWFQAGSSEVLFHDITSVYEGMRKVKGNRIDFEVAKNCPHDIILIGDKLCFEKEAVNMAVLANEFLRSTRA